MPPPDQAQPDRHDADPLADLVADRVRRDLAAAGREVPVTARLREKIRAALFGPSLGADESAAHDRLRAAAKDPVAALISMRVETALSTGLDEATKQFGGDRETSAMPSVVVLRRGSGDTADRMDAQVSTALSEVKSRIGHPPTETTRLFLLVHGAAFDKLRRRLPSLVSDDQRRVSFVPRRPRDEAPPQSAARDIEIVQADVELEPLEKHLAGLLARPALPRAGDDSLEFATEGTPSGARREKDAGPDALIGTLFHNKYRIVRKIGHGGFGSVYEARDERGAGNRVAIKVLRTDLAGNRALFQSFKNEARRVTRLSHPNIVDWKVFDETEDGTQYLVMELVDGEELDRVLSREGTLPPARVANILLQILDALRAAHHLAEGGSILHLDLKPRNVFLVQGKREKADLVKVIDFGIGQYIGGEEEEELPDLDGDTPARVESGETSFNPTTMSFHRRKDAEAPKDASGETKGGTRFKRSRACTPEYASPEQCVHVLGMPEMIELDGRSDIYSLGVMGFQMLTGHLPFQRPLMRSDMLRLHMQKAPRKVGAMGVRVPRALAKFIDRCLEKDRDKRFADTNAAWRELHRIVHPPVSHTVAKVVVPLVVIALVAIGTLWAKVGARAVPVALAATDLGLDLSREVLYLGPARPAAVVTASTPEGRAALEGKSRARLVLERERTPLDGWSAECDAEGRVTLAPSTPPSESLDRRVVLEVEDADVEFAPFHLRWLAGDAWSVRSIQVGSARLYDASAPDATDARAIDPSGLFLTLRAGGPVVDSLEAVTIQVADAEPIRLPVAEKTAQDDLYRASLTELRGLARGRNEITLTVIDRAGATWQRVFPVELVADPLKIVEAKLFDQSSSLSECNQALGRYSIYPTTRPLMRLSFDRLVDLKWRIKMDGLGDVGPVHTSLEKQVHEIPLDDVAPFDGTHTGAGTILIEADDAAYVVHAEGSDRGRRPDEEILFDRSAAAASIAVRFDEDGLRRKLTEGNVLYVKRHDVKLLVSRQTVARVKVAVSAVLEGTNEVVDSPESNRLKTETEAEIPLRLARDGRYTVTVNAFQYLTLADVVGERPDISQRHTIVVDTAAPKLTVRGVDAGALLSPKDGRLASLEVSLSESGRAAGSPVDVTWAVVRGKETQPATSGEVERGLAEPAIRVFELPDLWSGDAGLADGEHALAVQARDAAGNAGEPVRIPFAVAARGPRIELDAPLEHTLWKPTANGDWLVEVRATDPNGVDRVECEAVAAGTALGVPMSTGAEGPASESTWTGRPRFPESWSKAEVTLRFSSRDRAGVTSAEESGPFRLPEIEAASPEVVEVALPDRNAERLRLVRGNAGFTYLFGGQGDEFENQMFVQAGLDRFNGALGQTGRRISWAIPYGAGEIEDFYLDEHEVTCGQYLQFMRDKDNGYADRSHWPRGSAPGDEARRTELETRLARSHRDLPVTDVTWDEASAYAHWVGKRLPSWVEWEYAVRGGQAYRPFAACVSASSKSAEINIARSGSAERAPWPRGVGADVTPDTAIANLSGNVAEWTSTADLTLGKEGVDLAKHAKENKSAFLQPGEKECTHYWAVGGSYARSALSFFTYDSRERGERRASLGFRCASSLSDVHAKLADGRFAALETAGSIPK